MGSLEQLVLSENILHKDGNNSGQKRLILPYALRKEIFQSLHGRPFGGHRGINKVLESLRSRFYWPGMKKDVLRWVAQCATCQQLKDPLPRKHTELQPMPVSAPLDRIQLDIVGPLPTTQNGNNYILVLCDYFTKWAEAWALPNHTAQTVAETVVKEFVCKFGCAKQIHTDQGTEFNSHLFREMCALLGMEKTRTTPYRPNSDGLTERVNRTIIAMLRAMAVDNLEWDEDLPFVLAAYRASVHESTRNTPNMLMFGREITFPVDIVTGGYNAIPDFPCKVEYVEWLRDTIRLAHEVANKHLKVAVQRQKRNYGGCSPMLHVNFTVGDWVLRFLPPQHGKKFGLKWVGPFLVVEQISPCLFKIQKNERSRTIVVHCDHLKRYVAEEMPVSWIPNSEGPGDESNRVKKPDSVTDSSHRDSHPKNHGQEELDVQYLDGKDSQLCDIQDNQTSEAESTLKDTAKRTRRPPTRFGEWDQ